MFLYSDARTHWFRPPRSVHMAHINALHCGMVSSLTHQWICRREVLKMDSVVTDVEWGTGGGLYSNLSFLSICFRDLYPLMDWCVQTKCAPRSLIFQFTRSLVFWADLPAVALYRWLFISPAFSNRILTSTRNGEAHSLAYFRRTSLEGPHTLHWKIEFGYW